MIKSYYNCACNIPFLPTRDDDFAQLTIPYLNEHFNINLGTH